MNGWIIYWLVLIVITEIIDSVRGEGLWHGIDRAISFYRIHGLWNTSIKRIIFGTYLIILCVIVELVSPILKVFDIFRMAGLLMK